MTIRALPVRRTGFFRVAVALTAGAASLWVLAQKVDLATFGSLPDTLLSQDPAHLMLSVLLTIASFWAVARYDSVAHRHFQTGFTDRAARTSGFAAIALGQTIGFGVLTGAAVRWRVLPDLSVRGALELSGFVAASFMIALLFLTAASVLTMEQAGWWRAHALGVVILLPIFCVWLAFSPSPRGAWFRRYCPSLSAMSAILGWAALDLMAAALALYVLIPTDALAFSSFLPVFLLALAAALISGAPGGLGPFELTLLALLPQVPATDLICGIVLFRAVYYALPALLAVLVLMRPVTPRRSDGQICADAIPLPAEINVLRQNGGTLVRDGGTVLAQWPLPHTLVQLFDPLTGTPDNAAGLLARRAAQTNRVPVVYKCAGRQAQTLRRRGWKVIATAQDAVLDLSSYDVSTPSRARLRRSLRKAMGAGVSVVRAASLPLGR